MSGAEKPWERLKALVARHGEDLPLLEGAACIAAIERPGTRVDEVVRAVHGVADGLYLPPGEDLFRHLARLTHHLFHDRGFRGDEDAYDDPENSCLDQVVARRKGLPISLSILTIEVAGRRGLVLDPIGFPGHFLVAPRDADPVFFVDPFHQGRTRSRDELVRQLDRMGVPRSAADEALAPVSGRHVLMRIFNNLRASWMRRGDADAAMRSVLGARVLAGED